MLEFVPSSFGKSTFSHVSSLIKNFIRVILCLILIFQAQKMKSMRKSPRKKGILKSKESSSEDSSDDSDAENVSFLGLKFSN